MKDGCGVDHEPSTFRLPVTYATNALRKATPAPVFELQQTKVKSTLWNYLRMVKLWGLFMPDEINY